MSRRRIEAGLSNQSSFSLRALSTPVAAAPAATPAGFARNAAPPAIPQQAALSFKFSSLATKSTSTPYSQGSPPLRASAPSALPGNFFSKPMVTGMSTSSAESMRLTAVVDDLTQRLRKSIEAKTQLEGQVTRLNGALVQERSAAQQRLSALKTEVATVQDSEMRLRSELAARPAVREVDTNKFATRVRSALEQEETNAKVADAEARLGAVSKRHESLVAEVKLLESRKAEALEATSSALSAEEVDELVAKAAIAQESMRQAEDVKAGVEDDIARFTAMRDAHNKEMQEAETALFKATEATAAAVVDESAAKQQLVDAKAEHANMTEQVEQLTRHMSGLSAASTAPTTFSVTGAHAPGRNMAAFGSPMAAVEALGCCGVGVADHFKHDAPLNICALAPNASDDSPTNLMVTALVSDLQAYFQSCAADHAKIGRDGLTPVRGAVEAAA
jgi:predicted  nucleic acid-binding Zn-ribbon protein